MADNTYEAARRRGAVVAQEWMGVIALEGTERASWLQGMVTNDVEKLHPGEGCYAAHLNAQGKVVAQMSVLVEESRILLTLEAAGVAGLLADFDKLIVMEDVQALELSGAVAALGVYGPDATRIIESWIGEPLRLAGPYRHRRFDTGHVVRSPLGFDVWLPREGIPAALDALARWGAERIDRETWEILRLEAGLPVYGVDIDQTTTMPELGERGISYDKGCYIGQEVVARVKYIGHVNRRFVGLVGQTPEVPQTGSVVRLQGKDIGRVTSAVFSPGLGKPIALGFVQRVAGEPGTVVEWVGPNGTFPAVVSALPFIPAVVA